MPARQTIKNLGWFRSLFMVSVTLSVFWMGVVASQALRSHLRLLAGNPPYDGWWIVAEHAFLYTTLTALFCMGTWFFFHKIGWLFQDPRKAFGIHRIGSTAVWGAATAGINLGINIFSFWLFFLLGQVPHGIGLGLHPISGWVTAGNLFSNFYEEIIYRGVLFETFQALGGPYLALFTSSVVFGLSHTQYPLAGQTVLMVNGAVICIAYLWTRSLWAAWFSHQLLDMGMMVLFGVR